MFITHEDSTLFFDILGPSLTVNTTTLTERESIIVLPGGPGFDHSYLREGLAPLAEYYQIIFIDPPGCGRSSAIKDSNNYFDLCAEHLYTLIFTLGIDKPILLGHSSGCCITACFTQAYPEIKHRQILMNPVFLDLDILYANLQKQAGTSARQAAEALWQQQTANLLEPYIIHALPCFSVKEKVPEITARTQINIDLFLNCIKQLINFNFSEYVDQTKCKTLLLISVNDPYNAPDMTNFIEEKLQNPNISCDYIENAGHELCHDQPKACIDAIRLFIES